MQKRNRWQFWLIIIVIALTIYNILPTVFYYTKPLKSPIKEAHAKNIAGDVMKRVNSLEQEALEWVGSFCKLLKIKANSIEIAKDNPAQVLVKFNKQEDADKLRKYLPKAGALIAFVPAQLSTFPSDSDSTSKTVSIQRQIPIQFNLKKESDYFQFTSKNQNKNISEFYKEVIFDRASQIGYAIAGPSENSNLIENIITDTDAFVSKELSFSLAHSLIAFVDVFSENSPITNRYFASFTQGISKNKSQAIQSLISSFDHYKDQIRYEKAQINQEKAELQEKKQFLSDDKSQRLNLLDKKEQTLIKAQSIIKNNVRKFTNSSDPLEYKNIYSLLENDYQTNPNSNLLYVDVKSKNPFINKIILDLANDKIYLSLYSDVIKFKNQLNQTENFDQLIINEIARISRQTNEHVSIDKDEFRINLNDLENSKSMLVLKLSSIARKEASVIKNILANDWQPKLNELSQNNFPVYDFETYSRLPASERNFCLVVYAPSLYSTKAFENMQNDSIYIVAKGMERISNKFKKFGNSSEAKQFTKDFEKLQNLLRQNGFLGFEGSLLSNNLSNDFVFEKNKYYQTLIKATREDFKVHGLQKYATLEFTNVEQRILTTNKIETRIQEDLLKMRDDYHAAQVSIDTSKKFDVPAPTKNVLLSNLALSFRKYFRGDERKILHWGLDLSGGKSVQLELRDKNNKVVTDEAALKQGVNELYNRVNKMGVSEVNIRTIDSNIALDFPGAQGLSAKDLVKASTMYFHIVNEKFSARNSSLSDNVNRFLQEVWNEAVVTNKKDIESINAIAFRHLYGESLTTDIVQPRSESGKILYENGLRLSSPLEKEMNSSFNDTVSKLAIFRGDDFSEWQNQSQPLVIVFKNYGLEGSNLVNIRSSYDPSKGNFLSFEVRGSYTNKEGQKVNPREELYNWTSQFSKEKITGTPLEAYSGGTGWRMAVILNDSIISAPNLESALRDSAMISGSFSLREVNQLVADLKAGSLTFTPHILSEKNVSPELGKLERTKGVFAVGIALLLVVIAMISYYRFAGLVAAIAVIFNLIIMWATLQNLQATLTLASIAGIILTVGMAVDANVLVFERIKEEFAVSKRLASAVQNGYRKAFSAIFDSNLTTIIAALILLHFDSGPIKGFAITLIIGIVSSMFTALFMTRFFFLKWVQNPKHKTLKMMDVVKTKNFNFLKLSKYVFIASSLIILIGVYTTSLQKRAIFGMDFTGGYALSLEVDQTKNKDYRQEVEKALIAQQAHPKDFQIRELNPSNNLRILFSQTMDLTGRPFYDMELETNKQDVKYSYENNPRIVWVVNALKDANIEITPRSLEKLNQNWSAMSGQMSDSMRNNAVFGLLLALGCILIYITFRFEFKFAVSAMVCLIHDLLVTIAIISILNLFGVAIQIDLHTVAALMTIIGYSLNDTIVIFDRIREDLKHMRKYSYFDVVNHSLNITLSRTTLTSATTLVALLALVVLGGSTVFSFSLVMIIGIIFGTLSSLFIASPLMLLFHRMELKKQKLATKK